MRRGTEIPCDFIGAFVAHLPFKLTHPDEDRYLTYREAMGVMKLPTDFNLIDPKKNLNHICQNVPVTTAEDMAYNIKRFLEDIRSGKENERKIIYTRFADYRYSGELKGIDTAYFTKLIYFLMNQDEKGYILDQFTARSSNILLRRNIININEKSNNLKLEVKVIN